MDESTRFHVSLSFTRSALRQPLDSNWLFRFETATTRCLPSPRGLNVTDLSSCSLAWNHATFYRIFARCLCQCRSAEFNFRWESVLPSQRRTVKVQRIVWRVVVTTGNCFVLRPRHESSARSARGIPRCNDRLFCSIVNFRHATRFLRITRLFRCIVSGVKCGIEFIKQLASNYLFSTMAIVKFWQSVGKILFFNSFTLEQYL